MDAADNNAPQPSIKRLGGAFMGLLQGHLELIGLELQEEKARMLELLLYAGIALILAMLILVGLSAAIVIGFWGSSPVAAILILCILYGAILAASLNRALKLAKACMHPFQATLEELERNKERLLP